MTWREIMRYKNLNPNQIIALFDDPVCYELILKVYFRIFQKDCGKIISPCPVLHKSRGLPLMKGNNKKVKEYNNLLIKFLETHPKAEYFLLDGAHKTTAATLAHKLIPVMILESDKDIKEARKLVERGEITNLTINYTIKENIETLTKYFFKTRILWTVAEKTEKLVKDNKFPKYMVNFYKKHK